MSLCAICGRLLSNSELGRRPCCQARVHSNCIQQYAKYSQTSGNPNPSCPVCKQQAEDLQSKSDDKGSILSVLRKSSNSSSSGEGSSNAANDTIPHVMPKSPHVIKAEALIQRAEKRSAEKERQVADAKRQVAEEQTRLSRLNRDVADNRTERSRSPNIASQASDAFKKTIAILEEKIAEMSAEANLKQADFEKRFSHMVSQRKELEQNFNALADYSEQLQARENELSSLLEMERNEHHACKTSLSTAESQISLLNAQIQELQNDNAANEALLSSAQGTSREAEEYFQQQLSELSESLSIAQASLEEAKDLHSRSLESEKYYAEKCAELESSTSELRQRISELEHKEIQVEFSRSEVDAVMSQLRNTCSALESELEDAKQQIMILRESNRELVFELDMLRNTNLELESSNRELGAKLLSVQSQLNDAITPQMFEEQLEVWKQDKDRCQELERLLLDSKNMYQTKCYEADEVEASLSRNLEEQRLKIKDLQSELESLKEMASSSENQYQQALAAEREVRSELQVVKEKCNQLEVMLEDGVVLREENERLDASLSAVRSSNESLQERCSQLLDVQAEMQSEIVDLLAKEESAKDKLSVLKKELDRSEKLLSLSAERENSFEQRFSVLSASLEESEANHRSVSLNNADLKCRLDELELEKKNIQEDYLSQVAELKALLTASETQVENLSNLNETLQKDYSNAQLNLQKFQESRGDFEERLLEASKALQDSELQRIALNEELDKLRDEQGSALVQYNLRIEELQNQLEEALSSKNAALDDNSLLQSTIDGLKSDFERSEKTATKKLMDSEVLNSTLTDVVERLQADMVTLSNKASADQNQLRSSLILSASSLEECLQKLALNETQLRDAEDEIRRLNSALEDVCARLNESVSIITKRSEDCDHLKAQLSQFALKSSNLMSDFDHMSRDNARLLHMYERSDEECHALKHQLRQQNKRHKHICEMFLCSMNEQKAESESLQTELAKVKSMLAKSYEDRTVIAAQAHSIEELMPILELQRTETSKLQNEYSRVCALLEAMEDSKFDQKQQMEAIIEQLQNKQSDLEELRSENSTLRLTITDLKDLAKRKCEDVNQFTQTDFVHDEHIVASPVQPNLSASRVVPSKTSRETSPALSRVSTATLIGAVPNESRESTGVAPDAVQNISHVSSTVLASVEPILIGVSSVAASESSPVGSAVIHSAERSGTDSDQDNLTTSSEIDVEGDRAPLQQTASSSVDLNPEPRQHLNRSDSPAKSSKTPSPELKNDRSLPAMVPSPASKQSLALSRPLPVRRFGPSIARLPPSSVDTDSNAIASTFVTDAPVTTLNVVSEKLHEQLPPNRPAPSRPVRAPQRMPGPPSRFRATQFQAVRRGPSVPNRFPLPPAMSSSPVSQLQLASSDGGRSHPESLSSSARPSPRSSAVSRQPSSSSINVSDVPISPNDRHSPGSSRPESANNSPPKPKIDVPTRTAPPSRSRQTSEPSRSVPGRPGTMPGPSIAPSVPVRPTLVSQPPVGHLSVTPPNNENDSQPAMKDRKPLPNPNRGVSLRPIPGRNFPPTRRPGFPPRRMPNAPLPPNVIISPDTNNQPPSSDPSDSVMSFEANSSRTNRSRSPSPKLPTPVLDGASVNVRDASSIISHSNADEHRSPQSPQIRSRNVASKASRRSNSLLKTLLSSSAPDVDGVEKVDFVFDGRSGSWVPEGTIETGDDAAVSNVLTTVQRLRSQVHHTREEISHVNAELPDSKPLNAENLGIPEEKWVEACELLRESRLRLPKGDALRARIETFLASAGSDGGPLPDAVSELEDLLQTVQTRDYPNSHGSCCGRLISVTILVSVIIAVAASAIYAFYPDQAQQALDTIQAFVMKAISYVQWDQSDFDTDEFNDSNRIEL